MSYLLVGLPLHWLQGGVSQSLDLLRAVLLLFAGDFRNADVDAPESGIFGIRSREEGIPAPVPLTSARIELPAQGHQLEQEKWRGL